MKIEEGKIFLTFDGKEKELDPSNPDDLKKLAEQAEKGYAFEGGQTKLKSVEEERDGLRQVISNWNARIESAKSDPEAKAAFIEDLKKQGVDLTAKQQESLEFVDDAAKQALEKLNSKVEKLESTNTQLQSFLLDQVYNTEHAQLETKYNEKNGYPNYDRKAVQEYADKNNIVSFETAYVEMNKENIIKSQVEFQTKHKTKQYEKIKKVATDPPDPGRETPKPAKVYKKYNEATQSLIDDIVNGRAEPIIT